MARRAALVLLGLFVHSALSQLPPWDNQIFNFGWDDESPAVTRCQAINVGWGDRDTANPHSTPPYTLFAISGGNTPLVVGNSTGSFYNWTVELPTGAPVLMSMKDSNGYTGGAGFVLNVNEATTQSCGTTSFSANPFQLSSSGTFAQCSVATVTAAGGQAPYTMQIFAGVRPPKTTTWTTNTMSYTVDLGPTEQFFFVVTDAAGNTAVEGIHTVVSGDSSCFDIATTVIVGAVPNTFSYDPASTATWPTSVPSPSGSRVIENTDTSTVTSVITLGNGSAVTYTIPPGSAVTVANSQPSNTDSNSDSNSKILPAAIGGAVGGAAFVLLIVLFVYLYRRRQQDKYSRKGSGILPSPTIPFSATQIHPFPPSATSPEHAPLMNHPYSGNLSVGTPASTHTAYFNAAPVTLNTHYNPISPPQPALNQFGYNSPPAMYSPPNTGTNPVQTASPQMSITSLNRPNDLPPGAMPPRTGSYSNYSTSVGASSPPSQSQPIPTTIPRTPEKVSFIPTSSSTHAPPPYSH